MNKIIIALLLSTISLNLIAQEPLTQNEKYVKQIEELNKRDTTLKTSREILEEVSKSPINDYQGVYSPAPVVGGGVSTRVDFGEKGYSENKHKGMRAEINPDDYYKEKQKEDVEMIAIVMLVLFISAFLIFVLIHYSKKIKIKPLGITVTIKVDKAEHQESKLNNNQ